MLPEGSDGPGIARTVCCSADGGCVLRTGSSRRAERSGGSKGNRADAAALRGRLALDVDAAQAAATQSSRGLPRVRKRQIGEQIDELSLRDAPDIVMFQNRGLTNW